MTRVPHAPARGVGGRVPARHRRAGRRRRGRRRTRWCRRACGASTRTACCASRTTCDRLQRGSIRADAPGRIEDERAVHAPTWTATTVWASCTAVARWTMPMRVARANGVGVVGVRHSSPLRRGRPVRAPGRGRRARRPRLHAFELDRRSARREARVTSAPIRSRSRFPARRRSAAASTWRPARSPGTRSSMRASRASRCEPGLTVDGEGRADDRPARARRCVPLGGSDYGYKGYGLAMMIDLLCGALNGMAFGPRLDEHVRRPRPPQDLGHFVLAIDPRRFAGGATLEATVRAMTDDVVREGDSVQVAGRSGTARGQRAAGARHPDRAAGAGRHARVVGAARALHFRSRREATTPARRSDARRHAGGARGELHGASRCGRRTTAMRCSRAWRRDRNPRHDRRCRRVAGV